MRARRANTARVKIVVDVAARIRQTRTTVVTGKLHFLAHLMLTLRCSHISSMWVQHINQSLKPALSWEPILTVNPKLQVGPSAGLYM